MYRVRIWYWKVAGNVIVVSSNVSYPVQQDTCVYERRLDGLKCTVMPWNTKSDDVHTMTH